MGVERQRSKLRHFTFDLHYEPGYISPCDNASRKPTPKTKLSKEEKRSREWTEVEAVTLAEVRQALQEDHQLR